METETSREELVLVGNYEQHPGYTSEQESSYCQAARVCLNRFHKSPTDIVVHVHDETHNDILLWEPVDQRIINSQANHKDAARDGAYALSLLCVHRKLDLVAICRAEEGSGADWYIAPPGVEILEAGWPNLDGDENDKILRLEVSGQIKGDIGKRVKEKKKQLDRGKSAFAGIASVVGFQRPIVRITSQD